jgi:DNA-binding HxlR family transcriptional regulator
MEARDTRRGPSKLLPLGPAKIKAARQHVTHWLAHKATQGEAGVAPPALTILASKWLLLILLALMPRARRNSELRRHMRGVSPRMLSQSLRYLESQGMVCRQVFAEVPPRVEYSLTSFGESVAPLLAELCTWSEAWEAHEE